MALKDGARTWLLNLPPGTISSWDEMRTPFIAKFQATRDRPPVMGDLRRIKQQPGDTLQKYIQRFNNIRLKIPKVTDEAIISAFSDGVCDVKMKEELACRCQNRRILGRGFRTVRLRRMVTGGRGHDVLPRFGPS